ncbi:type VI secretion system tip protein VgrG, partial [Escherichia coli]|nr:type VI secretion system tip protein VgrG [Escherichia coli]
RFTLEVDGQEPDTFAVVNFRLIQNQSYPFVMSVDVASDSFMQTAEMLLEKKATLTIWQGAVAQRYVTGVVAGFGMQENNGWQMRYHLRIEPPLWRCGLRQNFRIFQQQDIRTISATLLNENGVTEWTPLFYEDHPAREFCVQYGESDLAFLSRLWAEEGIFFFERFAADSPEQKLTLCDDVAGLSQAGELPFNPDTSTGAETECVSMFRYEAHVRPSSVQSQDYTFKVPDWPGMYEQQGENLNGQLAQYEIFDYPGRFKDEQHGKDFTLYQMGSLRSDAEKATGQSNSPKLWPGTQFTLTGHPQKMLNREWQVVQSILSGSQPQALHGSQGRGTTLGNQLEVIPADRTWRPRLQSKPKVDGPQSAIVTGPAGEEIFCDEHGRVRVQFHWDRYNPATEASSCWVRVSQAWAGPGFGNLAIPRVGQEVIVDFLNGQLAQYEIFDYPGRFKDEQHGKDFTLYQMGSLRSDAEKATGQSNSPKLWPGTQFTLTGHPQKMLNREWQVVQSILSGSQPQALHGSQGRGTTLGNQLEVIPADRTWRPRLQSKPKVDGPQSAIVTGPAGEEIFCDEHGRVRVKFHWDRYHGMTEASSCWVRVSQAWAGPGFGNLAIPRVGQEVIVDL